MNGYQHFFADANGDGKSDWIQVARTTNDGYVGLATGGTPDLSTSISTSLGASTAITYKPLTDTGTYTKDSSAVYPMVDLQAPFYVVSSASTTNGVGGSVVTNYAYGGLKAELGTGRGFLGFRWMEATDAQTGIKQRSEARQDWPYVGLASFVKKSQSSGAVLSQTANTFNCTNPASGAACTVAAGNRYFPYLSQSLEAGNDLNGASLPTATTTTQYDTYGNATSLAVSTGDGYSKATTNTYTNDTANWLLGRLTRSAVQSTAPDVPPTSPASPSVSISPSPLTITAPTPETATGSATASAAGGVPPFTYSWSRLTGSRISFTGTQTATFSTSVAYNDNFTESFRVTATDAAGRTATSDLNVSAVGPPLPPLSVTISPAPPWRWDVAGSVTVTRSPTANVTGLPPFTYSWAVVAVDTATAGITNPQSQTPTLWVHIVECDIGYASFRVTVTDSLNRSSTADVTWTVNSNRRTGGGQCP